MKLNSFFVGSTFQLSGIQYNPTRPGGNQSSSMFSTSALLPPQKPAQSLQRQLITLGLEEYRVNADTLREKAILQAATSPIKIGKNSDGTKWVDTENINNPTAAREKMRETGGEQQISWHHVEHNLRWNGAVGTDTLDAVGQTIDYFASEYAQYKTRIERQYTGEEQVIELQKLDQIFATRIEEAASQFSQKVGSFLEENGVSDEQEAIHNSFLDIYEQRKTTYLKFINDNFDYAEVMGTEDEWLLTSGDFMGNQLRYALISEQPEMNGVSEHGYSVDELNAAGTLVKELTKIQDPSRTSNRSEEELGVELGMAAMKHALLTDHFNLSDRVKSKLDQAFDKFVDREIEKVASHIEQQRRDPFVRDKEAYAMDYNKQAVLSIIKKMVENLKTDDVNAAFQSDFSSLTALYKEKMQSSSLARYNAYYSSWTNESHVSDWNRFVQQLSISDNQNLSGNLLEKNIQWMDVTI